jgi:hypothetical protein
LTGFERLAPSRVPETVIVLFAAITRGRTPVTSVWLTLTDVAQMRLKVRILDL